MLRHLPNALTLGRLLAALALVPLLAAPSGPHWATSLVLFVLAAISDRLDGTLARALRAESDFGRFLDPLADKLLVLAALLGLVIAGPVTGIHLAPAVLIPAREAYISALRSMSPAKMKALRVTRLAKWKTGLQMCAIGTLMGSALWRPGILIPFGLTLLWIAAGVTLWTGLRYRGRLMKSTATHRNEDRQSP